MHAGMQSQLSAAGLVLNAGLLCGGHTILQTMLLAEMQVCTDPRGRAMTVMDLTMARRLCMPTMFHNRGRVHFRESNMGEW